MLKIEKIPELSLAITSIEMGRDELVSFEHKLFIYKNLFQRIKLFCPENLFWFLNQVYISSDRISESRC